MCKFKIIRNLYFHMPASEDFISRMDFSNAHHHINRSIYEITDLDLWFESDLEDGCVLIIKRVSKSAKYNFNKVWMEW